MTDIIACGKLKTMHSSNKISAALSPFYRRKVHFVCILLLTLIFSFSVLLSRCSLEDGKGNTARAHTASLSGINHAFSAHQAQRYCKQCHGDALQGGSTGEPSCFQCHGQKWPTLDPNMPRGDANHTENKSGYFHHNGLTNPLTTCVSCHGANLEGAGTFGGTPSCVLCHEAKW